MSRLYGYLAVVMVSMLLVACGTSEPTPTAPPTAPQDGGEPAQATGFEAEWAALIEAARAEGRLIVSGSGGVGDIVPVYRIWGEKFGITVTVARGSGRENADRLLAEQGVGRYDVDIVHAGADTLSSRLVPNEAVIRIKEILFHPEVIDLSLWFGGKLWFRDSEDAYMLVHSASVDSDSSLDGTWFNTDLVSIEEVESWTSERDVLERYGGSIIDDDPRDLGGTGGVVRDLLRPDRGVDYWIFEYSQDVFYTSDARYMTDSLARGAFKIALGGTGGIVGRELQEIRNLGAAVQNYETLRLERGWPLYEPDAGLEPAGSGGSFSVAKNARHPNATKLWVNWLLSREGMTTVHETLGESEVAAGLDVHNRISLRDDGIPWGLTDPRLRREPGVVYDITRMDPRANALHQDAVRLRLMIFEEARGFGTNPELAELRVKMEEAIKLLAVD